MDSAPAPPGAPTASVVVNLPTTRRRRASQACSLVATVSTRRPAPSSFPAPPPTSRPAAPRRSAPGPSVPPAACAPPRARQISMGDQDAIALIGQSMHPTRAAVKQLKVNSFFFGSKLVFNLIFSRTKRQMEFLEHRPSRSQERLQDYNK